MQRLKFVKFKDIISFFAVIPALICGKILSLFKSNIWLVCERKNEARDNGYWFYKYLCENHPEIQPVYAINKKTPDYLKVKDLGKVISFGSFNHWVYYFAAKKNISSQKEGKPNAAVCFVLEVYLGLRKNRAYIRHGICKDNQRWVYYDVTKMNLFACSANREFEFVKSKFGYPENNVKLLGLCRYDNLLAPHETKRQIIVMPTMREWLRNVSSDTIVYEGTDDISKSEYFQTWNHFLHNPKLHELLESNNINLLFFPHSSLQKYINFFSTDCPKIIIANSKFYDVQMLLMESSMLITDYSSIYFDFAFMKKPLIYYQFDYEKYRKGQYQEGYFSYEHDGFGTVAKTEEQLLVQMNVILSSDFEMNDIYKERVESFFAFHDQNNCQRTYDAIKEM